MPQLLPTDNAEARDWIQFRGPQTSVTHDGTGIRFTTEHRRGRMAHKPIPVVDDDTDPADAPDDAVARSVADELVEANPLICYGVACEVCGDVYDSPTAVNSHQSAHKNNPDHGEEDGPEAGGGE
jgi:hypothetical protein